ncbi:hypothetical protein [Halobacteriovorax sp. ZH2_bin.1]|uniref:hypothetical protein n=1 Tax=Halobacteriovorax sp. ZH2_bin.1 TaxID=3157724 RepID=UPI0037245F8A
MGINPIKEKSMNLTSLSQYDLKVLLELKVPKIKVLKLLSKGTMSFRNGDEIIIGEESKKLTFSLKTSCGDFSVFNSLLCLIIHRLENHPECIESKHINDYSPNKVNELNNSYSAIPVTKESQNFKSDRKFSRKKYLEPVKQN